MHYSDKNFHYFELRKYLYNQYFPSLPHYSMHFSYCKFHIYIRFGRISTTFLFPNSFLTIYWPFMIFWRSLIWLHTMDDLMISNNCIFVYTGHIALFTSRCDLLFFIQNFLAIRKGTNDDVVLMDENIPALWETQCVFFICLDLNFLVGIAAERPKLSWPKRQTTTQVGIKLRTLAFRNNCYCYINF